MTAKLVALESSEADLYDVASLSAGRALLVSVALERNAKLERQLQSRDRRIESLVEENRELRSQLDAEKAEALRLRAFVMKADMGSQGRAA